MKRSGAGIGNQESDMYKKNYIESLRNELVEAVQKNLSPVAIKYHYSDVPLEVSVKWRPIVLVIGNYSSGKSTLINELLGSEIQATGQAPTDDSFTVITNADSDGNKSTVKLVDERDGKVLLHDEQYPFSILKKHGDRFAAHFRLKRVNSPMLDQLAIIDTPGMLDSVSENDRGYDFQQVIGDLAQIADLTLVLFDPHKAGTIRETYESLRKTLPASTFEDRVVFVLNRIDECANLNDLLRVYGTLCWNLSQMTGRKDIPMIKLTYSENVPATNQRLKNKEDFLPLLKNQRDELRQRVLDAPRYRLDHLTSYIEVHGVRLAHYLEAIHLYARKRFLYKLKYVVNSVAISILLAGASWLFIVSSAYFGALDEVTAIGASAGIGLCGFVAAIVLMRVQFLPMFHHSTLKQIDQITECPTQARKDSWNAVKTKVYDFLDYNKGVFPRSGIRSDWKNVLRLYEKASSEARKALAEIG